MNRHVAQGVFLLLLALSVAAAVYSARAFLDTKVAVTNGVPTVVVDASDYYFLLMTLFWPLAALQLAGVAGFHRLVARYGSAILVAWLGMAIVAIVVLSRLTAGQLEAAAYVECEGAIADEPRQLIGRRRLYASTDAGCAASVRNRLTFLNPQITNSSRARVAAT